MTYRDKECLPGNGLGFSVTPPWLLDDQIIGAKGWLFAMNFTLQGLIFSCMLDDNHMKNMKYLFRVQNVAYLFIVLGIVAQILGYIFRTSAVLDFVKNVGIELLSIGISVVIIDRLVEQRQESELRSRLIRELGSEHNSIASSAADELRVHGKTKDGWLADGSISGAYLRRANLFRARLRGADLSRSNLRRANLSQTKLFCANFQHADMRGIDLSYAYVGDVSDAQSGANFTNANLFRADLSFADCYKTNFSYANLKKTNLVATKLKNADLSFSELDGAFYDRRTTWPTGFDPKEHGAILIRGSKPPFVCGPAAPANTLGEYNK